MQAYGPDLQEQEPQPVAQVQVQVWQLTQSKQLGKMKSFLFE